MTKTRLASSPVPLSPFRFFIARFFCAKRITWLVRGREPHPKYPYLREREPYCAFSQCNTKSFGRPTTEPGVSGAVDALPFLEDFRCDLVLAGIAPADRGADMTSVVSGKSGAVRVHHGGSRS